MMDHREAVAAKAAERYLLGEMNWRERDEFEAHFFDCPECAREVHQGVELSAGLEAVSAGFTPEPRASFGECLAAFWRRPVWAPAAAALGLALIAENAIVLPAARAKLRPQPVLSVLLKSDFRGAGDEREPAVRPDGDFFRLEAE